VPESIYVAFAVSVLRSVLLLAGGWLVSRGLVDDGLAREVAAGLAVIIVTQLWGFWRIHQRRLFEKWLLWLGLQEMPTSDPEIAKQIVSDAKFYTKEGMLP
jgi:hypothetical protein